MKIPKIRFSRFSEEWKEEKLSNVCKVNPNSGILPEKFIYIDLESVENGVLLKENYIDLSDAPSRAQRQLIKDDILFQTVRPYQKNNFYFDKIDTEFKYVASTGYAQLRANEDSKFLYQYLHTQNFVNNVLEKCTGTSYPAINSSDLSKIIIYKPSLEEQQKIGDFFTLLDKRIEQQEQKIALLKDYKKAMMQKIFSQKIRFKDENGNDYPDWEEKKLGEIGKFLNNRREAITEALRKNGKYPYYGATGIIDSVEEYIFDQEIILLGEDGAKWGENEESAFYVNHKCWVNNHAHVIEVNGNSVFLKEYLNFLELRRYVSGNAPAKLTLENARKILLNTPSFQEQEKIAFFLTSINKRIEKQENTLDKMQEYKEALLHKIFI